MQSPPCPAGLAPVALIVMGVSGSGKSTLGAALAQALDCPFLDGDDFHDAAAIAKMSAGAPLTDDDRWPWLDRVGRAMGQALTTNSTAVAACSALRRGYRNRLRAAISAPTRFILLDASPDELQRRLAQRQGHYMPASLLDSQLATLEPPDADEVALRLAGGGSPQHCRDATLAWLDAGRVEVDRQGRASGH